ncbi:MAG: hypothetical protein FWF85_05405, partial [Clostridiales bacterium]|nr:hypothetical protein [Clostridiales bacterium]
MNEYLSIFLGALVGCILPSIIKYIQFAFKRVSNNLICGEWHSYLWATFNQEVRVDKFDVNI